MSHTRGTLRQYGVAVRLLAVFTLGLGVVYPLVVTGIGQAVFPAQANGSLIEVDDTVVGSSRIGQSFDDDPLYFQSRPSAAGDGYDPTASSGSNAGPENQDLAIAIEERRAAVAAFNGVEASLVPFDAVTASASGLDPDISPEYARLQVARVAAARGLSESAVDALVESRIQGGALGYLSMPTVNVLELNVALDAIDKN
jgi:K+-transporting ATPase ATPase C chain